MRKRDEMVLPKQDSVNDSSLAFLQRATNLFVKWKASKLAGLTSETFSACIQSMRALPLLVDHLVHRHNFSYVLPGKLMSDPIEARFGCYRQMNGGNLFMSLRQLLDSEKKIRVLSKLQQQLLLSATALPHSDIMPLDAPSLSLSDTSWLSTFLSGVFLENLCLSDANVVFFVSGYIGRSIARQRRCTSCKASLVASDDAPSLWQCIPDSSRSLFEMADRGGLSSLPTEMCFAVTAIAVQCYNAVMLNQSVMAKLLLEKNQRPTFVEAVCTVASSSTEFSSIATHQCAAGHVNFQLVFQRVFNCFAKK